MTANVDESTIELFRPVGPAEVALIAASSYRAFPPRLPEQPIFYPVLAFAYAVTIARDWNARGPSGCGLVTRFRVASAYLANYDVHRVGTKDHTEYWIPAAEIDAFNAAIVGTIDIVAEYRLEAGVMRALRMMDLRDVDFVFGLTALPHLHDNVPAVGRDHIAASLADEDRRSFIIERDGAPCGIANLRDIGAPSRTVYFSLIAVTEPGRGDGGWALARIVAYAFDVQRAHRLWLEVVAQNFGARRLYERHGFVLEGTFRDGFYDREGRHRDLCSYAILEDEYRAISRSSSSPV